MGNRWLATAGIAAVALLAAACGSTSAGGSGGTGSGSGGSGSGAGTAATSTKAVKATSMGGAKVLTTAKGFTIYWFGKDTKNHSNCTSSTCLHYWPIVKGPVTETGLSGTFGVITRSDGTKQATWNGHPLYTYLGDTAPGQAKGNNLNIEGGIWKEVALSGAPAPAPSQSSSGGGGGGYGY